MAAQENHDAAPHSEGSIAGLVAAVALALVIAATGKAIATALGHPQYALLVVTVLALAVANLASRRMQAIKGEAELGGVLLLAYFVLIAMAADARVLVTQVGPATWFVSAVLIMHLIILLGVGWILRMPLPQLMLASNATIGGPASAAALSKSSNNVSLLTPSVLAGMLGYATSTFVALALADILRSLA